MARRKPLFTIGYEGRALDELLAEQVCLVDQPSIRDPKLTIGQVVQAAIAKLGENISIARFVRFKLGEAV